MFTRIQMLLNLKPAEGSVDLLPLSFHPAHRRDIKVVLWFGILPCCPPKIKVLFLVLPELAQNTEQVRLLGKNLL